MFEMLLLVLASMPSCFSPVQTPCDPMDHSLPGSSVHGILQARILEWVAMPSSRGLFLTQGWKESLCLLCLLHWQAGSLPLVSPGTTSVTWEDLVNTSNSKTLIIVECCMIYKAFWNSLYIYTLRKYYANNIKR